MKKIFYSIFILLSTLSCKKKSDDSSGKEELQPVVAVDDLLSDNDKWWSYQYYDISLSSNFKSLDTNFNILSKEQFLTKLTSGEYVPIEMENDSAKVYKLYKIPLTADSFMKPTIMSLAQRELHFYKMEGTDFPEFEAKDLEEKIVDNQSLNGKTTVVKTWFIACKPCIEEMPEFNKIVDKYQNEDFQFISLALDEEPELKKFLEKQEFKYAVLPNQEELIQTKLKLNAYPTHLVVDKTGQIEKVFSKGSELIAYLSKHKTVKSKNSDSKLPPPPPPATPINKSAKNDA